MKVLVVNVLFNVLTFLIKVALWVILALLCIATNPVAYHISGRLLMLDALSDVTGVSEQLIAEACYHLDNGKMRELSLCILERKDAPIVHDFLIALALAELERK